MISEEWPDVAIVPSSLMTTGPPNVSVRATPLSSATVTSPDRLTVVLNVRSWSRAKSVPDCIAREPVPKASSLPIPIVPEASVVPPSKAFVPDSNSVPPLCTSEPPLPVMSPVRWI